MRTTVFKSNKTQAVRIPKALALPDDIRNVEIKKQGNTIIITPVGGVWADFFSNPPLPADFMDDRDQPEDQEREDLF